jgi:cobalamin-dependent methionine synthase-like protein
MITAESVILDRIHHEPDREEVLRYLGYPLGFTPDRRVMERVEDAIHEARSRLRPRGAYVIHDVAVSGRRSLTLRMGARFEGAIGEYIGRARRAAVLVATAGQEIIHLSEEAQREGDVLRGFIHSAIGSQAAEAAAEALMEDLRARIDPGESLTLRYSPGYCGMRLNEQAKIFEVVDAAAIGVELLPTLMMKPLKSVSGLVGIGPASELANAGRSPCEKCRLVDCKMRR